MFADVNNFVMIFQNPKFALGTKTAKQLVVSSFLVEKWMRKLTFS